VVDRSFPWSLTAAALTTFAALYLTAYRFPGAAGLPVCAVLLLAIHFTHRRMPRSAPFRYGARFVAVAVILLVRGVPTADTSLWYFEPEYTRLAGSILAAELVIRRWLRVDPARAARDRRMFLLITALVMTAASNTYERPPIHALAPLYMLCVALSLRALALDPVAPAHRAAHRPARRAPLAALRALAFLAALVSGLAATLAVTKYDNRLTAWAVNLLRESRPPVRASAIGFSTAPRLGPVFNPDPSLDRTLLIDGPHGERHLRVLAFDTYDQTVWRPAITARTFTHVGRQVQQPTTAPTQALHFTRLTDTADLLPVPSAAGAVRSAGDLEQDPFGALRDRVGGANFPYDVTIEPTAAERVPLAAPPSPEQLKALLTVPPDIDRAVVALARGLTAGATPARRVFKLQQHLRANHAYSLSFQPAVNSDPLNDFILNRRAAHCQYFASAMVIMARAAGVPARMVTGYYAHESYGPDQTVVRERDAHAWAECYLDGVGWVTVDATPAAGRPDGLFPDPPRWRRLFERLRDLPGQVRQWLADLPRQRTYAASALVASCAAAVWIARALRTRRHRSAATDPDAYPTPDAELVHAAGRFERWLRATGSSPAPNRTWREHAHALGAVATPAVLNFIGAYDAARFGTPGATTLSRLRAALTELEQTPAAAPATGEHA
jgi:transglutaminase-like putative cysteine protease